jgi:hypothetical protein
MFSTLSLPKQLLKLSLASHRAAKKSRSRSSQMGNPVPSLNPLLQKSTPTSLGMGKCGTVRAGMSREEATWWPDAFLLEREACMNKSEPRWFNQNIPGAGSQGKKMKMPSMMTLLALL